jgi:hypothetical protein
MRDVGQSAAQFFGMEEGEAPIYSQLMKQFSEAQRLPKSCSVIAVVYVDLRVKVFGSIRSLTKSLVVVSLFFHMVGNNKIMVALYAV